MAMICRLSEACVDRVKALFGEEDRPAATSALEAECGTNLPLMSAASADAIDRVRFAAIRFSGGELSRLYEAIELAKTDWRDLLVASGFADDPLAHRKWHPR